MPVFFEEAGMPTMVKSYEFTNHGEVPWITADQPLYAPMKTI